MQRQWPFWATCAISPKTPSVKDGSARPLQRTMNASGAIDRPTYEAQLDKLNEQLALARLRAVDAEVEQIDAEGILGFAEHLAANASRLWVEFNLRQKQRFQTFIFPDGAKYAHGGFLNPRTSLLFNEIAEEPMLLVGNGRGERI